MFVSEVLMEDKDEVHYGSHRTGSDDFVWGE